MEITLTKKIEDTAELAEQIANTFTTLSLKDAYKIAIRACIHDVINQSKLV